MLVKRCPQCEQGYEPTLSHNKKGMENWKGGMLIQNAFPNATPIAREQLLTGICSDECWEEFLGINHE